MERPSKSASGEKPPERRLRVWRQGEEQREIQTLQQHMPWLWTGLQSLNYPGGDVCRRFAGPDSKLIVLQCSIVLKEVRVKKYVVHRSYRVELITLKLKQSYAGQPLHNVRGIGAEVTVASGNRLTTRP